MSTLERALERAQMMLDRIAYLEPEALCAVYTAKDFHEILEALVETLTAVSKIEDERDAAISKAEEWERGAEDLTSKIDALEYDVRDLEKERDDLNAEIRRRGTLIEDHEGYRHDVARFLVDFDHWVENHDPDLMDHMVARRGAL